MCPASNEKQQTTYDGEKKLKHSEKRTPANTWAYWKLKPSNKWR